MKTQLKFYVSFVLIFSLFLLEVSSRRLKLRNEKRKSKGKLKKISKQAGNDISEHDFYQMEMKEAIKKCYKNWPECKAKEKEIVESMKTDHLFFLLQGCHEDKKDFLTGCVYYTTLFNKNMKKEETFSTKDECFKAQDDCFDDGMNGGVCFNSEDCAKQKDGSYLLKYEVKTYVTALEFRMGRDPSADRIPVMDFAIEQAKKREKEKWTKK